MEKLDLTKILRNCPEGTKLYSPIFGEVTFVEIDNDNYYPIIVLRSTDEEEAFTEDGQYCGSSSAECVLFPSKDNRDWSTFKVKPQPQKFKPFQKVLVRNNDYEQWMPQFYSIYDEGDYDEGCAYPHICMGSEFKQCIPYEGNECLLGTSVKPKGKD